MVMELLVWLKKVVINWQQKWKKDSSLNTENYYKSIDDLPLENWMKCNDGDLKFTRKDSKIGDLKSDESAWSMIYDHYIQEFGLSKMYKKMLEAMKKRANLELDFVISGDRFKLTLIEMEIAKIEQMISNSGHGMTIHETLIHLSKWMGTMINTKNITTREYFTLLNEYGKANKIK